MKKIITLTLSIILTINFLPVFTIKTLAADSEELAAVNNPDIPVQGIPNIVESPIVQESSDTATNQESIEGDGEILVSELYKQKIEQNVYQGKPDPISGLTFGDLVKLSKQANPEPELNKKLQAHLSMVYITSRKNDAVLNKSFIRIAHWNIDRGSTIDQIKEILLSPEDYKKKALPTLREGKHKHFNEELNAFSSADIICLNEADIGMPRTQYKNIPNILGDSLGWNTAYASEFIELGPIFQNQKFNTSQYRGLHGNAIISKFPIVSAEVIRIPNFYDWYGEEAEAHKSPLEYIRIGGTKLVFSQHIEVKEVRHGSRNAIIADIKLPNGQIVTVVSTHLEDRAYPDQRLRQFRYLLSKIKDKKTPLILAGDFNTSTTETKPTSLKKEWVKRIRDPHCVIRTTGSFFVPGLPILSGLAAVAFSKVLQYKDPFYPSIPVIFPNHERRFYAYLKNFKFADGGKFDLRGEKNKSSNGKKGLLANSNQRHWKGFKSTFKLNKPRVIAYFKLDWFFIKPLGEKFTPFNGRTLKTLNNSFKGHLSDHNPITVDIKL